MKSKQLITLGIILFLIGMSSILIDNSTENDLLKFLSDFGRYVAMTGGGLAGYGYVIKKKNSDMG